MCVIISQLILDRSRFVTIIKKLQQAAGVKSLKRGGCSFVSVDDSDKINIVTVAKKLVSLGCGLLVCANTKLLLDVEHIPCSVVEDLDTVVSLMASGLIDFVISTQHRSQHKVMAHKIRAGAIRYNISICTTVAGAHAMLMTVPNIIARACDSKVYKLQDMHHTQVVEYEY